MSMREAGLFVSVVGGLLVLDVIVRAIVGGYDAAQIGGGDVAFAIGTAVILVTRFRLGQPGRR